jgi:hypothetical protein
VALDPLLWDCLVVGKTSHDEQGIAVSIQQRAGETVLLFLTDSNEARRHLDLVGKPSCDLLFWYRGENTPAILLFVELKGDDCDHACKQLQNTLLAVRKKLSRDLLSRTQFRAVIVSSASAPKEVNELRKKFQEATGVELIIRSGVKKGGKSVDLREYLGV